jgi:hypothetical protein
MTETVVAASPLNLYERQSKLGLHVPRCVGIVGTGGVGSWLSLFLALAGVPELWLWDPDTVSDTNLNRLPVDQDTIGLTKPAALERTIRRMRPDISVLCMGTFMPEVAKALDRRNLEWIVAGTDSLKSRQLVRKWAGDNIMSYMEIAAEGEVGTITDAPADFSTPEEDMPGYRSVPVHCAPCVMAASIASNYILHQRDVLDTIRIGWDADHSRVQLYRESEAAHAKTPAAAAPKPKRK